MINFLTKKNKWSVAGEGFTLIEVIVYLAIVSLLLVVISYLMIDLMQNRARSFAREEVNYNLRYITHHLSRDIRGANNIAGLSALSLELNYPGDNIFYEFDAGNNILTRRVGAGPAIKMNTQMVEVSGSFSNLSFKNKVKNAAVNLSINHKNPQNYPEYNASTTYDFSVEVKGKR